MSETTPIAPSASRTTARVHNSDTLATSFTVPEVASVPQALDDDAFRQLLADCKLFSAGPRNGLVPFDAECISRRLARHTGHDQPRALVHLAHWAASLGGGLDDTVLWLPANRFGDTT